MRRHLPVTLLLATLSLLVSCVTTDYSGGSSERPAPAVYIPRDLDETERRLVYEVESVLTSAGYRISSSSSAEYELDFRIESGPINTDTYLNLIRDGREVVSAYARGSGLLNRQQVIRQSFDKCLYEFEGQVPRVTSSSSYDSRPSYDRNSDRDRDYDYDSDRRSPYNSRERDTYDRPSYGY